MTDSTLDPFLPLSLDALFALDLPDVDFVVDDLLPSGSACLLSGREKSGKGLLTLDICISIALAEPFLDRAVTEGPTIYCAAEENLRDVRARVGQRLGARRDAPFYILPLDGSTDDRLQLDDPIGMQRLRGMVEDLQPRVLVLDTLRELHTCREDLSDDMGPLLRPVRQLAHQTGTTIIVNHHQNKGGNFRGSTAIRAAFDLEWAFTRTDDDDESDGCPRGTLKIEGRHGPRLVLKVRVRKDLRWELDGTVIASRDPGARERIVSHLITVNDWQTAEELATATSIKLKTIQNVLAAMRKETPPPLAVQGTGAKNEPRRYRTRSPHFEGFSVEDAQEMLPPDGFPLGGTVGGKHFRGAPGDAGSDRWTP
ncbi:MAG: helicase RepA family protein [Chloroflexota bacterium]|nr:helicase RepA family protein [Chloroflexota bacterium]